MIPDFLIHPKISKGHYSADFIIEAKLTVSSKKILESAKTQARSYAKLLNAKYSVIASREGIWITSQVDDYSEEIVSLSWQELKNEDNFHNVYKLIGKGKI